MKRREDWPERLHAFIDERRDVSFQWGVNDCVLFAADGILRMTDEDVLGDLRGQWSGAQEAMNLLRSLGGMEAVADARFERTTEPQRGDLGLMTDGKREFFGLFTFGKICGPGPNHLLMNLSSAYRLAWKVARG